MKVLVHLRMVVGSWRGAHSKGGLAALVGALLVVSGALAQEVRVSEPEFMSVFYYLRTSGEIVELERQTGSLSLKGAHSLWVIPGEKSPVRFEPGDTMQFVVRVTEDFKKAAATTELTRFEPRNGGRELLTPIGLFIRPKIGLEVKVEKYGSSSLKVIPAHRLEPGEYCLSRSTIIQGFCFGVDAAGGQQIPESHLQASFTIRRRRSSGPRRRFQTIAGWKAAPRPVRKGAPQDHSPTYPRSGKRRSETPAH
jgi:hypothetical protein